MIHRSPAIFFWKVGRGFTPLLHANESDLVPDIRGFGIKLLNVSGPFLAQNAASQVFTLTTAKQTFLDTAEHALSFFQAVQVPSPLPS